MGERSYMRKLFFQKLFFNGASPKFIDLGFASFSLEGLRQNWDFEVVSREYMDNDGDEYVSYTEMLTATVEKVVARYAYREDPEKPGYILYRTSDMSVFRDGLATLQDASREKERICQADVDDEVSKFQVSEEYFDTTIKTVYKIGSKFDLVAAKRCNLGVIRIMRGAFEDHQLLYSVHDMGIQGQLMAYYILTTGDIEPYRDLLEMVGKDDEFKGYMTLILGQSLVTEFMGMLETGRNEQ